MTTPDEVRRLIQSELDARDERRRLEWREKLRTAAPWVALSIAAASPVVTFALTRTAP